MHFSEFGWVELIIQGRGRGGKGKGDSEGGCKGIWEVEGGRGSDQKLKSKHPFPAAPLSPYCVLLSLCLVFIDQSKHTTIRLAQF